MNTFTLGALAPLGGGGGGVDVATPPQAPSHSSQAEAEAGAGAGADALQSSTPAAPAAKAGPFGALPNVAEAADAVETAPVAAVPAWTLPPLPLEELLDPLAPCSILHKHFLMDGLGLWGGDAPCGEGGYVGLDEEGGAEGVGDDAQYVGFLAEALTEGSHALARRGELALPSFDAPADCRTIADRVIARTVEHLSQVMTLEARLRCEQRAATQVRVVPPVAAVMEEAPHAPSTVSRSLPVLPAVLPGDGVDSSDEESVGEVPEGAPGADDRRVADVITRLTGMPLAVDTWVDGSFAAAAVRCVRRLRAAVEAGGEEGAAVEASRDALTDYAWRVMSIMRSERGMAGLTSQPVPTSKVQRPTAASQDRASRPPAPRRRKPLNAIAAVAELGARLSQPPQGSSSSSSSGSSSDHEADPTAALAAHIAAATAAASLAALPGVRWRPGEAEAADPLVDHVVALHKYAASADGALVAQLRGLWDAVLLLMGRRGVVDAHAHKLVRYAVEGVFACNLLSVPCLGVYRTLLAAPVDGLRADLAVDVVRAALQTPPPSRAAAAGAVDGVKVGPVAALLLAGCAVLGYDGGVALAGGVVQELCCTAFLPEFSKAKEGRARSAEVVARLTDDLCRVGANRHTPDAALLLQLCLVQFSRVAVEGVESKGIAANAARAAALNGVARIARLVVSRRRQLHHLRHAVLKNPDADAPGLPQAKKAKKGRKAALPDASASAPHVTPEGRARSIAAVLELYVHAASPAPAGAKGFVAGALAFKNRAAAAAGGAAPYPAVGGGDGGPPGFDVPLGSLDDAWWARVADLAGSALPGSVFSVEEKHLLGVLVAVALDPQTSVACRRNAFKGVAGMLQDAPGLAPYAGVLLKRAFVQASAAIREAALDLIPILRGIHDAGGTGKSTSCVGVPELLALLAHEKSYTVVRKALGLLVDVVASAASDIRVRVLSEIFVALAPVLSAAVAHGSKLKGDVLKLVAKIWLSGTDSPHVVVREMAGLLGAGAGMLGTVVEVLKAAATDAQIDALLASAEVNASRAGLEVQAAMVIRAACAARGACAATFSHAVLFGKLLRAPRSPGVAYHVAVAVTAVAKAVPLAHAIGAASVETHLFDPLYTLFLKGGPQQLRTAAVAGLCALALSNTAHPSGAAPPSLLPSTAVPLRALAARLAGVMDRMASSLTDDLLPCIEHDAAEAAAGAFDLSDASSDGEASSPAARPETASAQLPREQQWLHAAQCLFVVAELVRYFPWERVPGDGAAPWLPRIEAVAARAAGLAADGGGAEADAAAAMALRCKLALCVRHPFQYFRKYRGDLEAALARPSGAAGQQGVEGVTFFLQQEAEAVEALGRADDTGDNSDSGIGNELAQQYLVPYISDIALGCGGKGARAAAVDFIVLVAGQGYVSPMVIASVLTSLMADPSAEVASRAEVVLHEVAQRFPAEVHTRVPEGVANSFGMLCRLSARADVAGHRPARGAGGDSSVHDALYRLLAGLPRADPSRVAVQIFRLAYTAHAQSFGEAEQRRRAAAGGGAAPCVGDLRDALQYIRYVHESVGYLPFRKQGEVLAVLHAVDVQAELLGEGLLDQDAKGQSYEDWLSMVAVVLSLSLKAALKARYGITTKQEERYRAVASGAAGRPGRVGVHEARPLDSTAAVLLEFSSAAETFLEDLSAALIAYVVKPKQRTSRGRASTGFKAAPDTVPLPAAVYAPVWARARTALADAMEEFAKVTLAYGTAPKKRAAPRKRKRAASYSSESASTTSDADASASSDDDEAALQARKRSRVAKNASPARKRRCRGDAVRGRQRVDVDDLMSSEDASSSS